MERLQRNAVPLLLAGALAAAAVLIFALTADLTFFGDEWKVLLSKRDPGVDVLLRPHNEHLVAFPILIDQALVHTFGIESARPAQVVLIGFLSATAVLLFFYVRRRLGPWPALAATVLVLFLGPAWEVLLWPFEITLVGAVGFGIAALLALEREDGRGDVVAVGCLTLAIGFSNLGVVFILAAAVAVLVGPREAWLRRSYVFLVPGALFALWYLGWGNEAESHISLRNVLASSQSVLDSAAMALGSLAGLGVNLSTDQVDLGWGRVLLAALAVGLACRALRGRGAERWLWPVAAALLASWFLTAFNLSEGRGPTSSRYQYASCILVLMVLANLFKGVRLDRTGLAALVALTALALGPNLVQLKSGSRFFEQQTVLARSGTAAIEIARDTVDPGFQLNPEVAGTHTLVDVFAGPYLEAVDRHGSPAYTPAELAAAPPDGRRQADVALARALGLATTIRPGAFRARAPRGCVEVPAGAAPAQGVRLRPGTTRIEVPPGPDAAISLRRFAADGFPVSAPAVPGGSAAELTVPRDRAPGWPWFLRVEAVQGARVCR